MSHTVAAADTTSETLRPQAQTPEQDVVRHWNTPIVFAIFTLISLLLFTLNASGKSATFRISTPNDAVHIPDLVAPTVPVGWVLTLLMAALTVWAFVQVSRGRSVAGWLAALFALLFVAGFLVWVVGSAQNTSVFLTGLIAGSFVLAVPLIFGSMAGVLSERAGVVNIAIEAQLLGGAFTGAVVASATGSTIVGIFAAMLAGVLVSMVLAVFSIRYYVEQVIVGVVLNVLVAGLTNFFYSSVLTNNPALNSPDRLPKIRIPLLADIPLIGPALFQQTVIVYAMYIVVPLIAWGLFKTTWGLRLRAVGEHPMAADTVGIKVNPLRFWNVSLAGAVAGLGGAYFTLDATGAFTREMTNGLGYIALAAVIFVQWHPLKATAAALLFGFASALQQTLGAIGSPVPSEFMLMLPYVITILAVAGFIGQSRAPAASGKPYVKQ